MQVVIPMSGRGARFQAAGYTAIKPLIEIDGMPMIEHVVRCFPGERDFLFICANDHLETTPLRSVLERIAPGSPIVGIEPHKKGPVWAALQAERHIRDDGPVMLHYCDYSVGWNYAHFLRTMHELNPAGCIQAYRGFHPHSLGPNLYAYMREHGGYMLEIKEKHCFTNDRMNEYASSGAYWFRSGALLKQTFHRAVERNLSTNGEYYASSPFNLLVEDKQPVAIYPLEHFVQWGTPEDLQEYVGWSEYFAKSADWQPKLPADDTQILLPMVGAGVRFQQQGYTTPKPLVPVAGVPMVKRSLDSLPAARTCLAVCRSEHLAEPGFAAALSVPTMPVEKLTEGQACTCLLGLERLDLDNPLLIAPCDSAVVFDEERYASIRADPEVDCVVWTFRNHPHANRYPNNYGWMQADADGRITGISCKKPLGSDVRRDPGIIGTFWFRKARYFKEAAEDLIRQNRRVNNEFYVDSAIEVLLEQGRRARVFDVKHLICFGVPDDVRTFEYWESYFRKARIIRTESPEVSDAPIELSIVLPCFNEAENLPPLIARYAEVWQDLPAELILVNNGSTDNSAEVLERELKNPIHRFARTVLVPNNQGYGDGIHTGLLAARGEFLAFSHADMQCNPADVFAAYRLLKSQSDPSRAIVKGKRAPRDFNSEVVTKGMSLVATTILMTRLSDVNAQPKVFHRSHLERLTDPPIGFPYDLYVVYAAKKAGLKLLTVPVVFGERAHGQSKWAFSFLSRWRTIWNMVKYIVFLRFHPPQKEKNL